MRPGKNIPITPSHDLKAHLAHVRKLYDSYPLNTYQKCSAKIPDIMAEICGDRFPHPVAKQLGDSVRTLLRQSNVFFNDPPDAEDADYLTRLQALLSSHEWPDAGTNAVITVCRLITSRLPRSVFEERAGSFSVPLYALMPDMPDLIMRIAQLSTAEHGGHVMLKYLNDTMFWNTVEASGYDHDTYDGKKLTFAHESKLEPDELIQQYLHGTPFADLLNVRVPFWIPESSRNEHFLMIARTGSGKTQYIQRDILDNLSRRDGPGMVVIDSQNQMIPKLERLQAAKDRIVIVDPFDASPPALNMFLSPRPPVADPNLREALEANTLQQFAWIFSALDQELTGRQTTLFTFTTRILLAMKANMQTLLDFMRVEKIAELKASKFWPYIAAADEQTRYFFENRFCTNDYNKTKGGVADRLLGVLRVPSFNRMFMAPANNLDLYSLLAQRKLVVFNTHKSSLGNDASAILGRYAIALYIRAAFERELDRAPPPAFLYVDEASEYFGKKDSSDTLFTQLRKYNCGTFVAFQDLSQLGEQRHTLVSNTSTKLAGGLSVADAKSLASDMGTTDSALMNVRKIADAFEMMCHVGNVTPRAIKLTFPYGAVENAPKLTAEDHAAMRDRNRRLLSVYPEPPPQQPNAFIAPASSREPPSAPPPPDRSDDIGKEIQSSEIKPGKDW